MYCFTYANTLNYIFNNLFLWSKTTAEHPIFIKTVAELTNKNLSAELVEQLTELNKTFYELNQRTKRLNKQMSRQMMPPLPLKQLIQQFLVANDMMINVVTDVKEYGKDDEVWQMLLEHILSEQKYMNDLFEDLLLQIG